MRYAISRVACILDCFLSCLPIIYIPEILKEKNLKKL